LAQVILVNQSYLQQITSWWHIKMNEMIPGCYPELLFVQVTSHQPTLGVSQG